MLGLATALFAGVALYLGSAPRPSELAAPSTPAGAPTPVEAAPRADEIPPSRVVASPALELGPDPVVEVAAANEADSATISAVVRKSQGRMQSCLETSLLQRPNLTGRVALGWSIVDGRVTDVRVVSNDTGEDALAVCMGKVVLLLRFPADLTAEVAEFPWVFQAR